MNIYIPADHMATVHVSPVATHASKDKAMSYCSCFYCHNSVSIAHHGCHTDSGKTRHYQCLANIIIVHIILVP